MADWEVAVIEAALMFAALLVGHYIADAQLQPPGTSQGKRDTDLFTRWRWLAFHGTAHGFFVAIITGSAVLGLAELFAHAFIDRGKGRGWYGMKVDQGLHVVCKVVWVAAHVAVWP